MVKKPNQKPQNLPMKETMNIKSMKEEITVSKNQKQKKKRKGNIKRSIKETRKSMFQKRD